MADTRLLSPEQLRQLLTYNPETGELIWRERPDTPLWRMTGQRADKLSIGGQTEGYRRVLIYNKVRPAHRIAWTIYHGKWPDGQIDHINGDRADNRISNLRDVSKAENSKNLGLHPANKSGVPGVHKTQNGKGWYAQISVNNRTVRLGRFDSFEDAKAARLKAQEQYGYHPNHCSAPRQRVSRQRDWSLISNSGRPEAISELT